jgi:hypothetical protein
MTHQEALTLKAMIAGGGSIVFNNDRKRDQALYENLITGGYIEWRAHSTNIALMPGDSLHVTDAGREALKAHEAAEKADYERRKADYARLTAPAPPATEEGRKAA